MEQHKLSSLDLLKEISAFLSFNVHPDQKNITDLKKSIDMHIEIQDSKPKDLSLVELIDEKPDLFKQMGIAANPMNDLKELFEGLNPNK